MRDYGYPKSFVFPIARHELDARSARGYPAIIQMTTQRFDAEARERLIIWIRRRMAEFNISFDDLAAAIHEPVYRDAHGNEWNGHGEMPAWLKAATHAGASLDFFRTAEPLTQSEEDQLLASEFFRRDVASSTSDPRLGSVAPKNSNK
ncbi:H-NS family nucleoid-associated regulatory protein [Paraburkholderia sp. SIMBA_054]|uniref:H-NS histone family protein n=1 Tax=Paraburkholderia sp. SIMBA_054 TaxID=3085795 RepID=UPI00397D420C